MENIKAEDDQLPCTGTCAEDESTLDIQEGFKVEVSPIEEEGSELQYPCIKQEEPAVKEEVLEVQVAEIKEEVSPLDHGELSQDGRQTSSTSTTISNMEETPSQQEVEFGSRRATHRQRKERFTPQELDILLQEVEARRTIIYGTKHRAPRATKVKDAWEQIAASMNGSSSGIRRTAQECRKRFNDVRRRSKHKLSSARQAAVSTGGGPSTSQPLTSTEEITSSTLHPSKSVMGFGGQEVGLPSADPIQQRREDEYPTHLRHTDSLKREEQREDEATGQQDNCVRPAQGSPAQSPSVRQSPRRELVTAPRSQYRRRIMEENSDALQPFLRLQQSGFNMLQRELRLLGRNLNSRVGRLEHRVGGMEQSLFRINNNLSRLADAAERYLSRAPTSDAAV
ncbi:myb-related transcription factor, partner of profilin isoform X6 [Acipenser ruthenus]|uniref:myb-related transcription factor, partner of profilin isoform X6 n=1 Tax=Acipenser ruthenus TaxID=7906 RepID=UPI00145A79A6|nr:myb-related transcription factor, partner of profilin isoform X6 [Acipenser ruthenus]